MTFFFLYIYSRSDTSFFKKIIWKYQANCAGGVEKWLNYTGFGQNMPGRTYNTPSYKYGMNGQEKDDEIFQGALSAEYWEYDSRTGRKWEDDPIEIVGVSPYVTFNNNPVLFSDVKGDKIKWPKWIKKVFKGKKFGSKNGHYQLSKRKQGKGTAKVVGIHSENFDPGHKAKRRVKVKDLIRRVESGQAAAPIGYASSNIPGPSTTPTGGATGWATKNAIVHFTQVLHSKISLDARAIPDKFTINTQKFGPYPKASTPENPFPSTKGAPEIYGGDIIDIEGELQTLDKNSDNADTWDIESIDVEIKYRYGYTKWAITRPTIGKEEANYDMGRSKRQYINNRVQTGWQDAPPGVPGARPLLSHSIKYIIKFLLGGFDAVDKSK